MSQIEMSRFWSWFKNILNILTMSAVVLIVIIIGLLHGIFSTDASSLRNFESNTTMPNALNRTSDKICEVLPPKDDFSQCGNRIADRKCCEYKWMMNNKDKILDNIMCTGKHGFKVFGAVATSPGEFPHMAALGWLVKDEKIRSKKYIFMCGGSLISNKFVLTAAHCTYHVGNVKVHPKPYLVRLGSNNINNKIKDRNRKDVVIKNIIKHDKYASPKYYYDIALLELMREVIFTNKIHPACLSSSLNPAQYVNVNITGWGVTSLDSQQMSDHLQVATVNVIDNRKCHKKLLKLQRYNRKWNILRRHQICAGVEAGGIDTCKGDSGGPIQVMINTTSGSMHIVLGVTSMGRHCGLAGSPGIYTSVASVLAWIEKTVWPEDYTKLHQVKRL